MSGAQAAPAQGGREGQTLRRGLSASAIKWIALFFMTLDHIAAFGFEIPIVGRYYSPLRLAGRIAAPLFLFTLVQGLRHTRSRPKFLLRLYLAGMGAGLFVAVTDLLLGEIVGYITPGNIMFTFFYVALYAWAIEGLAVVFLAHNLIDSFLPTLTSVDYGGGMVFLGVVLYFAETKRRQCGVFAAFCLVCVAGAAAGRFYYPIQDFSSFTMTFFDPFQCWMALALPFMLLYSGQRGKGPKWFFYIYYPTHRYVISVISAAVRALS